MVTVRMSVEEREMLKKLSDEDGLSASDILRQLLRKEHAARFPTKKRR